MFPSSSIGILTPVDDIRHPPLGDAVVKEPIYVTLFLGAPDFSFLLPPRRPNAPLIRLKSYGRALVDLTLEPLFLSFLAWARVIQRLRETHTVGFNPRDAGWRRALFFPLLSVSLAGSEIRPKPRLSIL